MAIIPVVKKPKKYIVTLHDDGSVNESWHGYTGGRADCLIYDTEQECIDAHPVLETNKVAIEEGTRKAEIDKNSLLDISKMHLAKAWEADRIVYDNITDPKRVPILSGEATALDIPLLDLAYTVLQLHETEGKADNARIAAKHLDES